MQFPDAALVLIKFGQLQGIAYLFRSTITIKCTLPTFCSKTWTWPSLLLARLIMFNNQKQGSLLAWRGIQSNRWVILRNLSQPAIWLIIFRIGSSWRLLWSTRCHNLKRWYLARTSVYIWVEIWHHHTVNISSPNHPHIHCNGGQCY